MRYRSFFLAAIGTTVFVLTAAVTFNYRVDPYFIHQWDTPLLRRMSPPQQKIIPWVKTYAAYRYQPEVVYLGSSRAEIGLPTDTDVFKDKRVLNLAVSGASLGDAINMLNHTSYFHQPQLVIWGLDFGWQFRQKAGNTDLVDGLIAKDSGYPVKRLLLNLKRSLSMTTTRDAIGVVTGMGEQKCLPMLASYGQKSAQCLEYIMADEGGTKAAFAKITTKGDPQGSPADVLAAMHLLDQATKSACHQDTKLRFFLHPVHALAELSYWENNVEALEDWKRGLVRLFDQRRQEGCDIRFIDFSGYNRITAEAIPQQTGRESMDYYWEHSHYRSEAGELVLQQLLAQPGANKGVDFGVELDSTTIEAHLRQTRLDRSQYCRSHPQETAQKKLCAETYPSL